MADIGAKISIDGEKQFRQELKEITQQGKTLSAQMDTLTSSFDRNEASEEDLAKVSKKLNEQIENQKKLVDKLKEAVAKSTEKTGENSLETQKWKEKLAKAEEGLNNLEREAKDATGGVKDLSGAEEDASEKTSIFGDVLKGNLASEAIRKGISLTVEAVKKVAEFFADAVKGAAEYADEVNTLAKTTGMSTTAIQEYKYAADLLDVSFETIQGSLTKLTKSMDSARDGSAKQTEGFAKLGVSVTDANGNLRSSEDVFNEVIDALAKIPNEAERDAVAMDILGKSAKDLNPLIEAGSEAMNSLRREAHSVGAVMDRDTLDALSEVQDGFDRLTNTWDALKKTLGAKIGIAVLPELERLVKVVQDFASTGDVSKLIDGLFGTIEKLINKIPTLIRKIDFGKIMKSVSTGISKTLPQLTKKIGEGIGNLVKNAPKIIEAGVKLIGGLLKGVVMAIPNLVKGIVDGLKSPKLTEAAQDTIDMFVEMRDALADIPSGLERIDRPLADLDAGVKDAEHWVNIFEEIEKKTDPTAADLETMKYAASRLNEIFPELGLAIDADTGKWNLNSKAIRESIDVLAARARAEAYFGIASEMWKDVAQLERDRAKVEDTVTEATSKVNEATAERNRLLGIQKDLESRLEGLIPYTEEWHEVNNALDENRRSIESLNDEIESNNAVIAEGEKTISDYDEKINNLTDDINWFYKEGEKSEEAATRAAEDAAKRREENAKRQYDQAVNNAAKYFESLPKTVRSKSEVVGEALGDGIISGMDKRQKTIADHAGALVTTAINKMRNVAQIHSPSKLTRDLIGKNLALGVIEGWKTVMKGREFKNTFSLSGVMNAMQSEIRPITNNETTNLGGVTINIPGAQNINENKLADIIMLKIQAQVDKRRNQFSNVLHVQ